MLIALWILGGSVALGLPPVLMFSKTLRLRQQTQQAWSHIDEQLKRRYELIPHAVETAREYLHHEHELLHHLLEARHRAVNAETVKARAEAEANVHPHLHYFLDLVHTHPELSCHELVSHLKEELHKTEEKIHFAREYYTEIATKYNERLQTFPGRVWQGLGLLQPQELFECA